MTSTRSSRSAARLAVLGLFVLLAPAASAAGSFSGPFDFPAGDEAYAIAVGDLNGDTVPDLAVANQGSDNVSILIGNGAGFTLTSTPAVGNEPLSVVAGDLDGDADLDLAVANHQSDNVTILSNDGAGSFTTTSSPIGGDGPRSMAAGDVDGDSDLAVASTDADTVGQRRQRCLHRRAELLLSFC